MGLYDYEVEAQKGNALGITWLASSGDSGAAGCDYDVHDGNPGSGSQPSRQRSRGYRRGRDGIRRRKPQLLEQQQRALRWLGAFLYPRDGVERHSGERAWGTLRPAAAG